MKCPKCGQEIPANSHFCLNCGCPVAEKHDETVAKQSKKELIQTPPSNSKSQEVEYIQQDDKFYQHGWFIGLVSIILIAFLGIYFSVSNSSKNNPKYVTTENIAPNRLASTQVNNEKTETAAKERKKVASKEILQILGNMPQITDEVNNTVWYQPWGKGSIPAQNAIYWYAGCKNNYVWMRAKIVNFSSGVNWVFWEKVIFHTSDGNWEYQIKNVFAGQSGGGKHTQVVMGGKYETLDVPYGDLKLGYEKLITGTNPIIRLAGKEYNFDYKLTSEDINHLKTGVRLAELLQITDGEIVK